MKVSELIKLLNEMDGDAPVVIAGTQMGFGVDFEVSGIWKFDNSDYVSLVPGDEAEEE
jgi:hypothetical protein